MVVGRSHPHITVLPSHVDVRTQAAYQMLDEGFVGIIISAFNRVRSAHPQPHGVPRSPMLNGLPSGCPPCGCNTANPSGFNTLM